MNIKEFLEIEEKYGLITDRIDDINYWEISRFHIWQYEICTKSLNLGKPHHEGRSKEERIKHKTLFFLFHGVKWGEIKKNDILILNHPRRVKVGEYYDCIYTEEIAEKYDAQVLEGGALDYDFEPIRTRHRTVYDAVIYFAERYAYWLEKTSLKYKRVYSEVKKRTEVPLLEMMAAYDINISLEYLYKYICKNIFVYKYLRRYMEKVIKRVKPKVIVEVCHYNLGCMAINEIARAWGIETVEMQHGSMHEDHAAYQYLYRGQINQLPNLLLTFSDYWNNVIHMPKLSTEVVSTGFPYFENEVKKVKNSIRREDDRVTIIFVSQGTIGRELSKLAVDLNNILDPQVYRIIYKLHPGEFSDWKDCYPWLLGANQTIEIGDTREHGIYEYFAESDIQVGVYSTALYEGLGYGLDTYIYEIGHASTMKRLIEEGYMKGFKTVGELSSMIKERCSHQKKSIGFWKMDAMDNITKILDEILK